MSGNTRFCVAETSEEILKVFVVRAIVFCGEQQLPYSVDRDEHDFSALHVLGQAGDEPVAAGRIRFIDGCAKLERLAVRKEYRGRGFGHLLAEFMIKTAGDRGFAKCKVHARVQFKDFYAGHGFQAEGEVFQEVGINHILMVRDGS
jgi:predicted GNAT family N-acyltransferase